MFVITNCGLFSKRRFGYRYEAYFHGLMTVYTFKTTKALISHNYMQGIIHSPDASSVYIVYNNTLVKYKPTAAVILK